MFLKILGDLPVVSNHHKFFAKSHSTTLGIIGTGTYSEHAVNI